MILLCNFSIYGIDMEKTTFSECNLYSDDEFRRLILLYQQLLNMLIRELPNIMGDFNIKWAYNIKDVKRWLKDWTHQIFWDYLSATHWSMENLLASQFDKNSTFRCIKIIFNSGWSITLINNPKMEFNKSTGKMELLKLPKWILCFDNYRKKLDDTKASEFDKLYMKLNQFERDHFGSIWYKEAIWIVINSIKTDSIDIYRDKIALVLNLQPE